METNNKLREALETLVDLVEAWQDHLPSAIREGEVSAALDKANVALAEPTRNCEVGTAEEQAKRWYWRYHEGHLCQTCPLGPRKWSEVDAGTLCFSEWLQMPYDEQKGGVDDTNG